MPFHDLRPCPPARCRRRRSGCRRGRCRRRAFFVRPDDHLERMPGRDAAVVQRLQDAERGERAEVAVEVAAARHRVDMRAEQDRLAARCRCPAAGEDVAGRIDARLQAGRSHQVHDVLAACDVGVRVGDAADAVSKRAARRTSEHTQLFEAPRRRAASMRTGDGALCPEAARGSADVLSAAAAMPRSFRRVMVTRGLYAGLPRLSAPSSSRTACWSLRLLRWPLGGRRCAWSRQLWPSAALRFLLEQVLDRPVTVDHARAVAGKASRVGGWPVRGIERAAPQAEVRRQLPAVVRRVRNAARQHPRARAGDVEEPCGFLEPFVGPRFERHEALFRHRGVVRKKREPGLWAGSAGRLTAMPSMPVIQPSSLRH